MLLVAVLLAAASLLGKAAFYGADADASAKQADDRTVAEFLNARGWVLTGTTTLLADGGPVLRFEAPGCRGTVRVSVLPADGEMASLFAQAAGPGTEVFYAFRGRTSNVPPRLAYLYGKLDRLTEVMRLPWHFGGPLVAVSQPHDCRLATALPWSEL